MKQRSRYQPISIGTVLGILVLLAAGCDRTGELAKSDRAPARAGKLVSKEAAGDTAAIAQLEKCAAAYKRVTSYQDSARVVLGYKVNGQPTQDIAPLNVAFESPNRLGLKAYQVVAGSTDKRFRLRLNSAPGASQAMNRQVISRALPAVLNMPWLMSDPLIAQYLSAGLAGSPPQLELLFGEQPFRSLLEGATSVTLDGIGKESGQSFHIVNIARGTARYRLWISSTTALLRRIELPSETLPPAMLADQHITDLHLSIELDDPKLGLRLDWNQWQVPVEPLDKLVRYFVTPPEVELDARLGKRIPAMRLPGLAGNPELDTSLHAQAGKVQVLVWSADHPACRTTIDQTKTIHSNLPPALKSQVVTSIIWAEAGPPAGLTWTELIKNWNIEMPLVQDLEAAGRDVLGISEAPTLVILDAQHRLQLLQPGANPHLAQALPALLHRIVAGENLAGDMVQKNHNQRQRFEPELWMARASDTTSGAFTQPGIYPTGQLSLKPLRTQKVDSNVLTFQSDSSHNLWWLNAQGKLIGASSQGAKKTEIDTGWMPESESKSISVSMAIDANGQWIALAGHKGNELLLLETKSSQRSAIAINPQIVNDMRWLNTPAGKRLAAITDGGKTLLIDPQRAQQHSGQSPGVPLALLPRPQTEAVASGLVILGNGRVEPIIVQDEGGASSAALAKPVSLSAESKSAASVVVDAIASELKFTPSKGPWSPWSDGKTTLTLARGWLAADEPAVFVLDERLRQLWHAPLPIEAGGARTLLTVADDPITGGPIWALSSGDSRVHFFNGDGRLVDHCQLPAPIRGVALIPVGKELQLWIAHPNELTLYSVR